MGKVFDGIDEKLERWISEQQLFFVATAPSGDGGHVNCSPKGPIESLRVLGPRRVGYLDLVGSGAETIAHLRDNGRIVSCSARSRARRGSCACTAAVATCSLAIQSSTT